MIRGLVIIAIAGFLTSLVCLSAAVAIGGPAFLSHTGWTWDWSDGAGRHGMWRMHRRAGPEAQRAFPWTAASLEVNAPAEVDYVQAAGPAKLTISGPASELDRVRVEDGRITLPDGFGDWNALHITLSAPNVSRFALHGANHLSIKGYNQEQLAVEVSGHADVTAEGQAKTVELDVSGAGTADLAKLKTAGADIDISGAGQATAGPTDWAKVNISGMGDVELLTRPARLESHVSGAGRIRQPGQDNITAGQSDDDDDDRGPKRET